MEKKDDTNIQLPELKNGLVNLLAKKPAETMGTVLSDLIYLAFGSINHAADKKRLEYSFELEKFKQDLIKKEKNIPEEERKNPDPQFVGLALEKMKYSITKKELREMFINLLVASIDKRKEDYVHPSYIQILSQLDVNDAIVLNDIYSVDEYVFECMNMTLRNLKKSLDILENLGLIKIDKDRYERLFLEEKRDYSKHQRIMVPIEEWDHFLKTQSTKYSPFSVKFQRDSVTVEPFDVIFKNDLNGHLSYLAARFFKNDFTLTSLGKDFCDVCIDRYCFFN